MSTRTTFILFGSTNPYLANFGPFNRRTRIAHSVEYTTREGASEKLMSYHEQEDDNTMYSDDGTKLLSYGEVVMQQGDMSYEHDSRTWEFIALADLTEEDARIARRDIVLSMSEIEEVYQLYPALRPEPCADEENA